MQKACEGEEKDITTKAADWDQLGEEERRKWETLQNMIKEYHTSYPDVTDITPKELKQLMQEAKKKGHAFFLVDVRGAAEVAAPSYHVEYEANPSKAQTGAVAVFYCTVGYRSGRHCQKLLSGQEKSQKPSSGQENSQEPPSGQGNWQNPRPGQENGEGLPGHGKRKNVSSDLRERGSEGVGGGSEEGVGGGSEGVGEGGSEGVGEAGAEGESEGVGEGGRGGREGGGREGGGREGGGVRYYNLGGSILAWAWDGGKFVDQSGAATDRAHVFGPKWSLLPAGYEPVYYSPRTLAYETLTSCNVM
eukprot:g40496.t1